MELTIRRMIGGHSFVFAAELRENGSLSVATYAAAFFELADATKVDTAEMADVRKWQAEVLAAPE